MKKVINFVAILMFASLAQADRQYQLCDPVKSVLCAELSSIYEFDEASDFVRTSEIGGITFLEPDNINVANDTTNKKTGAASLSHTAVANSYVYVPRAMGPSGQFTTSFWLRVTTLPSASTKRVQILSTRDALGAEGYPRLYLYHDGTSVKVRYEVKESLTDTIRTLTTTAAISASTWYMVSFGQHPYSISAATPYSRRMWVSINAGTKAVLDTLVFPDVPTFGDFIIGGWSNTSPTEYGAYQIDQLASWGGTFSPADLTKLYNSGSGKAFPFVD